MTTNRISNLFKKFALALIAIAIFIAGRFSAQPVVTVEAGGPPPGVKLVMDADRATDCILLCGTQSQLDQAVLNWVSNDDGGNDDSIVTPTPTTTTTVTVTPTKTPVTPTPRPSITPSSTPEITPTPDVTSTPIPQTPEPEKTKANCGVGNGEDGDTPGCPGGSKDGPGTGPGNPGAGGGNNK